MDDFKKELKKLNLDDFKASTVTPSDDTVQAQFFGGRCFRCFLCFNCFRCFSCFECFRCFNCFRCARG